MLLGFFACALALLGMRGSAFAGALADRPNERSLHAKAVPRIGGIGILAGVATAWLGSLASQLELGLAPLLIAYLALAAISWVDDRRSLPIWSRLPVHLLVGAVWLGWIGVGGWALLAGALLLAASANLFNFMDGADGLAGGMAAVGFATCAIGATLGGGSELAWLCAVLSATSMAFLLFNFPPASLFLGDAGSIPLGFAAAAIGWTGARDGLWSAWFPLLVFFPFLFDSLYTLTRRALRGEAIWRAHREHLYQKCVLAGPGHRGMTLRAYLMMGICATLALVSRTDSVGGLLIISALLPLGGFVARRIENNALRHRTSGKGNA